MVLLVCALLDNIKCRWKSRNGINVLDLQSGVLYLFVFSVPFSEFHSLCLPSLPSRHACDFIHS